MNIRPKLSLCLAISLLLSATSISAQTLYRVNSGTKQRLNAVFFASDSDGFAVGDSGIVNISTDGGNSWSVIPSGVSFNFYTEYFSDSANGAFAGDVGLIYTILGDNPPTKVVLPESNPISGMTFPSYDTGVVCGSGGLFYMTTDSGKSWKKKTLPAAAQKFDYYGVDYFDDDTYWLVGQIGLVLYTQDDGTTWQRITVPTTKDLYSINFPDTSLTGWIVGDQTLLLTTDGGDTWSNIPTTASLRFVSGWDSTHAYAVGLNGAILYTTDRSNWSTLPSGTTANLYGLDFPDSVFFVGDSGLILTTQPPINQSFVSTTIEPTPTQSNILLNSGGHTAIIQSPMDLLGPIRLEVFNLLGISVYSSTDVRINGANLLPTSLPLGVYMYRLINSSGSQVGKFSLE